MARQRSFDRDEALRAAVKVFSEHGFEGSSSEMLLTSMGIGRQSLYDTFTSKWDLYLEAVRRYTAEQVGRQIRILSSSKNPEQGLRDLIDSLIKSAVQAERPSCLGVSAICEFGRSMPELSAILDTAGQALKSALEDHLREAQEQGYLSADLDVAAGAAFVHSSLVGLKVAARGGADEGILTGIENMVLRSFAFLIPD
jgi:TetR/AcrR family transcriptional regulator, transcriptional repressor for nem operon